MKIPEPLVPRRQPLLDSDSWFNNFPLGLDVMLVCEDVLDHVSEDELVRNGTTQMTAYWQHIFSVLKDLYWMLVPF